MTPETSGDRIARLENLKPVLKVGEVAEVLGVDRNVVYRLISAGRLRATNISTGGKEARYRVLTIDLVDFFRGDTNQGHAVGVAAAPAHRAGR